VRDDPPDAVKPGYCEYQADDERDKDRQRDQSAPKITARFLGVESGQLGDDGDRRANR
jgi:hypothetical protein